MKIGAQKGGNDMKKHRDNSHPQAKERGHKNPNTADTYTPGFQLLQLRENKILLFEPLSLWYFVQQP